MTKVKRKGKIGKFSERKKFSFFFVSKESKFKFIKSIKSNKETGVFIKMKMKFLEEKEKRVKGTFISFFTWLVPFSERKTK